MKGTCGGQSFIVSFAGGDHEGIVQQAAEDCAGEYPGVEDDAPVSWARC